ncbi:MAG: oligopeptide transporter, OPT family [Acidobacteria bacterium]|nr:oligopeptide transporter, OPT family [Acidobacteriota bacterium]
MAAEAKTVSEVISAEEPHKPYVSPSTLLPEFTLRAVIFGVIFGIIFGASTVYLGLKVGLTVSASIPIAVLAITILRALPGRASILENNIVQTTGSAAESIAAGIVFTIPALLILGLDIDIVRTSMIAAAGGLLGVLLMIPLRRSLIVKEHANLPYPEGTACADVLIVGEKGGSDAKTVFLGFGVGFVYKFLMLGLKFWREIPNNILAWYQNARVAAEISPELLGVGYIIGPRVASYMLGGGVIAALVLTPMIKFFGAGLTTNIFPAPPGELIGNMSASLVFDRYVRYIAAGAVAAGGVISLLRSLPTIVQAFRSGIKDFSGGKSTEGAISRTERDIPIPYAMGGVILLLIAVVAIPRLEVDWISALMILVFGFFFVTVSSRITGQIGSTSNPISGMTIATLLFTSLIFLVLGRMGAGERIIALTVGAIVCVAAANAGNTSQDLKTGYLVGATPKWQQVGLLIGALTSALVIGWTLDFLNRTAINLLPVNYPNYTVPADQLQGQWVESPQTQDGKTYRVVQFPVEVDPGDGRTRIAAGKYLVGDDNKLHYLVNPGVGGIRQSVTSTIPPELQGRTFLEGPNVRKTGQSRGMDDQMYERVIVTEGSREFTLLVDANGAPRYSIEEMTGKLDAPKAALMGVLVDGVLTQRLPWALIMLGAVISIMLEIIGVQALPVAVGIYLPISTSATIFAGGLIRTLVNRVKRRDQPQSLAEEETGKGVLLSSGLIAGGAIGGLIVAGARATYSYVNKVPTSVAEERIGIGGQSWITSGEWANVIALIIFAGLAYFVYVIATRPSKQAKG